MPTGPGSLLVEVANRAPDVSTVIDAVSDAVRAWVGVGPVFVATADPVTGSFTGTFTFDIPDDAAAAFFDIEAAGRDVCSFEEIAKSEAGLGALFTATDSHPEHSQRWREVMSPLGWGDELRAAVRAHGYTWGYLCLHRDATERPFAPPDVARLTSLLPAVAAGLRAAAVIRPAAGEPMGTGVILCDHDGRIVDTTGAAAAWLDELGPSRDAELPLLLQALCRRASATDETVCTSITTRSGRVAEVEAAQLQATAEPCIAMVLRTPPATVNLQRFAAAVGLTTRERDVVTCVLRGLSTREIAEELCLSVYTVQTHLTAVFAKARVGSRRELVSGLHR